MHFNFTPAGLGGSSVRIILTVDGPDTMFEPAVQAGALQVYAVNNAHGWRIGRAVDPYGHHWEIGKPLAAVNHEHSA